MSLGSSPAGKRAKTSADTVLNGKPDASEIFHRVFDDAKDDKAIFMNVYDVLVEEIITELPNYEMPPEAIAYIKKMVDYNVPLGKLNRGLTVVSSARALIGKDVVSKQQIIEASILGWCVEWLQALFLVADDVMDQSITRRGQPCWYKLPEIGYNAVNDSLILESLIFRILQRHFRSKPSYMQLVELLQDVSYRTQLGQLLDLTSQEKDKVDLTKFTMDTYKRIVKYKTAFYSFYLPVALGMIVAGVTDEATFTLAESILLAMGEYFQIQDDVLDCYGAPEVIGKIGTDIQDNKCSWLIVTALDYANEQQRETLKANYAKHEPDCVAKIKEVYKELDLEAKFAEYEASSYAALRKSIDSVTNVPPAVFDDLLSKIYKRQK